MKVINTEKAPGAIGPYSQGFVVGNRHLQKEMTKKAMDQEEIQALAKKMALELWL